MQLGFAKAHYKITLKRKGRHGPGLGEPPKFRGSPSIFTQWLKLVTSNLVHSLGLSRPIVKSHPEEKVGVALGYWSFPKYWVHYNIFATAGARGF